MEDPVLMCDKSAEASVSLILGAICVDGIVCVLKRNVIKSQSVDAEDFMFHCFYRWSVCLVLFPEMESVCLMRGTNAPVVGTK